MRQKLGEYLVQAGLIVEPDLQRALAEQKRTHEHLGIVLVRMNLATEEQIAKTIASQLGLPYLDLASYSPEPEALLLVSPEIAREYECLPLAVAGNVLAVAIGDPLAFSVIEDLESQTGHHIQTAVATRGAILAALDHGYQNTPLVRRPSEAAPGALPTVGGDSPRIEDVFAQIIDAFEDGASDVHIEPSDHTIGVRNRVDGVLKPVTTLPRTIHEPLVRHIKSVAGLDVQEMRLPQDGRIGNLRVSTLRTIFGEKVVMQRLASRKGAPALDALGLSASALEDVRGLLRQRSGLIVFVGPGGSGTTASLAAAVGSIVDDETSVVMVADPVEYEIPGVSHAAIDPAANLTAASALRATLQQAPDVLAIGELTIETAALAFDAAQAGCLVIATLRADDTASAVGHLLDRATTPDRVATLLIGVVAQRLVRRLCAHCRRSFTPTGDTLRTLGGSEFDALGEIYEPVGCDECQYTGYRGRTGIFEVLRVSDALCRLIASASPSGRIREQAVADGMATFGEDGLSKLRQGTTTLEELSRVAGELVAPRTLCTACGAAVSADFKACPRCGQRLDTCLHCGRALASGWQFCPYCARGTAAW